MRELELYIHIPFCARKCEYCDFLSAPASKEQRDRYVRALLEEICGGMPLSARTLFKNRFAIDGAIAETASARMQTANSRPFCGRTSADYVVVSVFLGGGTPSLLDASQIVDIMEALRSRFLFSENVEVTIECNPGTVDLEKLQAFSACGINRISFGLQSANNAELKKLGRIHTWEAFLKSYEEARKCGFANINIDLMSALPGQTAESWEQTLRKILMLAPEHISAYSLIIEEGTPFYQDYHEDDVRRSNGDIPLYLPSEDEERAMYARTEQLLSQAGLFRYEISNYARPGSECRHNIGYWRGTEYMGFGLGASSLLKVWRTDPMQSGRMISVRLKNPIEFASYEQMEWEEDPDLEILSEKDEMEEFMFLGLRMMSGVSEKEFLRRFGCTIDSVYGETVERMRSLGLLQREKGNVFLTSRGIDLSNQVMAEFIL